MITTLLRPLSLGAFVSVVVLLVGSAARAEPASCTPLTRENVGPCAVAASLTVRAAALATGARRADLDHARVVLPSNPTIALSFARRTSSEDRATNVYAQLGQELEVAGQRALRLREGEATVAKSEALRHVTAREVASSALQIYFEVLAAREETALARKIEAFAKRVADAARGQAAAGAGAEIDADVAEAQLVKRARARVEADGRLAAAEVRLSRLTGAPPNVVGNLAPLDLPVGVVPAPEIVARSREADALDARATTISRARVPNVTISLFAQSDGFRERVLGAGLAIPIPLPEPLGRSRASEIAATRADAERARVEARALEAERSRERDAEAAEYAALVRASDLFDDARAARTEASLTRLAEEVERGRMHAREAFVAEDALADLLAQRIDVRRNLCRASVRLAVLRGASIEGAGQ